MLGVHRRVSSERFFDEEMLALARWISRRYVAPLASVLGGLSPPRVAREEASPVPVPVPAGSSDVVPAVRAVLGSYDGGDALLELCAGGTGAMTLRPGPVDEQDAAVEAVAACLRGGRRAIVLVPEATPLPATAHAIVETFGERAVLFAGGDRATRYRTWRSIKAGVPDVVVGTRPAVFAPVDRLGLIYVAREAHPGHREDRAPYHHVRDVAIARARPVGAAVVLAAFCHSSEAAGLGLRAAVPRTRSWPKVEVVRPGPEGRSPRLAQALRDARRGFVFVPSPGAGVAHTCRACGASAACAACGGALRLEDGALRCVVCLAPGRCRACGADRFTIRTGGAERVAAWAERFAGARVRQVRRPRLPRAGEIVVGGPDDVRDLGPGELDLVAIVEADRSVRRPGTRERALATWMEAAAWAAPSGRVQIQASDPADVMIQALVRGNADRFLGREREDRRRMGFAVGSCVFRVIGDARLGSELETMEADTLLVTSLGERTVCLAALAPERLPAFGDAMRRLAVQGVVERVEAEPHL
jgi:primosomal protein N' (replication factor Y)